MRVHAVDHLVDRLERPRQILREAGVVRLVDLQMRRAGAHQLLQLEIEHAAEIERERLLGRVVLVLDPLDQRMRSRDRNLRRVVW